MCKPIGSEWLKGYVDPTRNDELRQACLTAFNRNTYPECASTTLHSVGSLPLCIGSSPNQAIFDIQGNVREWAGCWDPATQSNPVHCDAQGAFTQSGGYDKCEVAHWRLTIKTKDDRTGFRCCADPL